jgi:hypothetical protein
MKYEPAETAVLQPVKLYPWLWIEEVYVRAGMKSLVSNSVSAAPRGYLTVAGADSKWVR